MGNSRFRPEGDFFGEHERFVFERDSTNEPFTLKSTWAGGLFVTDPVTLVEPTEKELAEYDGVYTSEELLTTYRVKSTDGSLFFRINNLGWEPLEATVQDEFVSEERVLRFTRNDLGRVNSLTASLFRVRGIVFDKQ